MMRIIVLVVFSFAVGLSTQMKGAYSELSVDGDWDFTFKPGLSVDTPDLPKAVDYDIKLRTPDYMNFQVVRMRKAKWWKYGSKNIYVELRGSAFYRKIIDVPARWQGKSIVLHIGRVYERANVWVNGKHLGFFPYACFTPVDVDLSETLKAGEKNEIIVSVDNKKERENKYFKYGGIVEPVFLKISNSSSRIDDLFARSGDSIKEIAWDVDLKNPFQGKRVGNSIIQWKVKDVADGKIVYSGSKDVAAFTDCISVKWISKSPKIKPWHPNSPVLYVAELVWKTELALFWTGCCKKSACENGVPMSEC